MSKVYEIQYTVSNKFHSETYIMEIVATSKLDAKRKAKIRFNQKFKKEWKLKKKIVEVVEMNNDNRESF